MNDIDVLFIAPPQDGFYYNLCYNFTELGEVATYVKKSDSVERLDLVDESVNQKPDWRDIERKVDGDYDVILIWNRFENLHGVRRIAEISKAVNPSAKVVTYGQPSTLIPKHFTRGYMLDAIVGESPWEVNIKNYLNYLKGEKSLDSLSGLLCRSGRGWFPTKHSAIPNYPFWELPDLAMLPLNDYFEIYAKEERIAGIGGKKEIGFSLSRGCQVGCRFCNVSKIHGRRDVRKDVESVMKYLDENSSKHGFDFVSLFSPIFTIDKSYAIDFSNQMEKRDIAWKCVTHPNFVDGETIKVMGKGGCQRIGLGIETMQKDAQKYIGKMTTRKRVEEVIDACNRSSVQPLIFLMLGIPGETRESFVSAVKFLSGKGAKIRVTGYTPFYNLRDGMSIDEVSEYDRQLICSKNVDGMAAGESKRVITDFDEWLKELK